MLNLRIIVVSLLILTVWAVADDEPERYGLTSAAAEHFAIEDFAISDADDRMTVTFTFKNTTNEEQIAMVTTGFVKSDGSVVHNQMDAVGRAIEGGVRALVTIATLGFSEINSDPRVRNATIRNRVTLPAKGAMQIEHRMPYASKDIVGSYSFVAWLDPTPPKPVEGVTDNADFFDAMRAENARYRHLEKEIRAERAKHDFFSPEYKEWDKKFWDAHREHFRKLDQIRKTRLSSE